MRKSAFQPVEVVLGRASGDLIEVNDGLFEGDRIVTQRAPQLYAQSLLKSGQAAVLADLDDALDGKPGAKTKELELPWWVVISMGGAIAQFQRLLGFKGCLAVAMSHSTILGGWKQQCRRFSPISVWRTSTARYYPKNLNGIPSMRFSKVAAAFARENRITGPTLWKDSQHYASIATAPCGYATHASA